MENEKDIQDIRERLIKIETLLENYNKNTDLKLNTFAEKLAVANHRISDLEDNNKWEKVLYVLSVLLGFFIIDEPKIKAEENKSYFKNILYGFRPSVIKENKMLYIYLICFAIFGISIQIFKLSDMPISHCRQANE